MRNPRRRDLRIPACAWGRFPNDAGQIVDKTAFIGGVQMM
jgi:hypothetical protein